MQNNQISDELLMIKMTPEAISNTWPELKNLIEPALPPLKTPGQYADRMTYILEALLFGKYVCHVIYRMEDKTPYAYGICVTSIISSFEGPGHNLLIYAAYGHTKYISGDSIQVFINKIREYARGQGCKSIVLYSAIPAIIEAVKALGGNADYRLLMLEV